MFAGEMYQGYWVPGHRYGLRHQRIVESGHVLPFL